MNGAPWITRQYQRAIAQAIVDPTIPEVTLLKSSRVGYTKLLVGILCYWVAKDPKRVLLVQPTKEDSEGFSKEDLQPGFDECDAIAHLIRPRTREGDNTTALKRFPGGWIRCGGSHTGRTFRRIEPDVAIGDELDGWPQSAGTEGDQVELMRRRLQSVAFPKLVLGSSPGVKGGSRTEKAFLESNQQMLFLPCPHCDHGQRLRFGSPDVDYGLKFSTESEEEARRTAHFLCEHCRGKIEHRQHQAKMMEQAQWVAGHRDAKGEWVIGSDVATHAGFHIWAAHSPDPQVAWGEIAAQFVRVRHDPLRLQPFVNTVLGETWEQRGASPNADVLFKRREEYPSIEVRSAAPHAKPERVLMVPRGGVLLTAAADVQLDRLEAGIEAWGYGQENWKLEYRVFHGDPTAVPVWRALWEWLTLPRQLERGGRDFVRSACIDTGYAAQQVADFVRPRQIYRTADGRLGYLWAVKGDHGPGPVWPQKPTQSKYKCPLFIVKVNTAKDALSQRGRNWPEERTGPGVIHFPRSPQFDESWFRKYGAEHRIEDGQWDKKAGHDRNEPWDVSVYNYAALCAASTLGFDLDAEALRIASRDRPEPTDDVAPTSSARPPARPRRRTSNAFR